MEREQRAESRERHRTTAKHRFPITSSCSGSSGGCLVRLSVFLLRTGGEQTKCWVRCFTVNNLVSEFSIRRTTVSLVSRVLSFFCDGRMVAKLRCSQ